MYLDAFWQMYIIHNMCNIFLAVSLIPKNTRGLLKCDPLVYEYFTIILFLGIRNSVGFGHDYLLSNDY